jgi:hypothetical protein
VIFWTCKSIWCSCIPLWWAPWGWQLVETYVGVFSIGHICVLTSTFVGCYEDCEKVRGVQLTIRLFKNVHVYETIWNDFRCCAVSAVGVTSSICCDGKSMRRYALDNVTCSGNDIRESVVGSFCFCWLNTFLQKKFTVSWYRCLVTGSCKCSLSQEGAAAKSSDEQPWLWWHWRTDDIKDRCDRKRREGTDFGKTTGHKSRYTFPFHNNGEVETVVREWLWMQERHSYLYKMFNITALSPTKRTVLFPDILHFNVTLNTAICFDPLWDHHQGITLKQHCTKRNWQSTHTIEICKINQLQCRRLLCNESCYTEN